MPYGNSFTLLVQLSQGPSAKETFLQCEDKNAPSTLGFPELKLFKPLNWEIFKKQL